MTKKIYRSDKNKLIAGVCGGIGEYFDIDPVVVRLFFILFTLLTGIVPGLLFYIICILLVPKQNK